MYYPKQLTSCIFYHITGCFVFKNLQFVFFHQCSLSELVSADVSTHIRVKLNVLAAKQIIRYKHTESCSF